MKLATFFMLGKNFEESRKKIDAVFSREPDNIDALFLLAGIDEHEKKLPAAEAVFKKILVLDSNRTGAYIGLGRVLAQQGKFPEAEKTLMKAIDLDPETDSAPACTIRLLCRQKGI